MEKPAKTRQELEEEIKADIKKELDFIKQVGKLYIVKQLKNILKQHISDNDIKVDYKVTTLSKKEVIKKLYEYDFKIEDLPTPTKSTRSRTIKTVVKQYTDEEQEQFLNKGYEVIDPLKAKGEYFNIKTGKSELVKLLAHQEKFLRKFFLSGVSGSVVFHGVGTGKSLTASVASHYYLSLNPNGNIIFISPPALILNFVNALKQFGLDEKDKRISYYTFEKFTKNPIVKDKKTLVIVDEAHLLRTKIDVSVDKNSQGEQVVFVNSNKRGYFILDAIKKSDKCILLTGTPFINKTYDIENLLAMTSKADPLDPSNFSQMITDTENRKDYFKYKISHYENEVGSEFFPEKIELFVPFVMNDEELQRYQSFEDGNVSILEDPNLEDIKMEAKTDNTLTSFYNGTRQYSNLLDYKKIEFIINRIKNKKTTGQFIIYTTFIANGLNVITKRLKEKNITFSVISGNENIKQKEESKDKYNSKEVEVLVITKAGTEGIDTISTEAIFIYEGSSWNEPLIEQAVARAIRFKSHYHLPKEQQKVYVYRLLIVKDKDKQIIDKINKKQITDYTEIYKQVKTGAIDRPSIETRLTLMSLAKKQEIMEFVKDLDKNIQQLEDYETPFEKEFMNLNKLEGMTDKEILDLQKELLNKQKNLILKVIQGNTVKTILERAEDKNSIVYAKLEEANLKTKKYQAYFTPESVVEKVMSYSQKIKSNERIDILEPTAGIGNFPIYILKNYDKNYKIHLVEIQEENRKLIKELVKTAPDILELYETKNFLRFINPIQYDLIIMNPPFHLYKNLNKEYLTKDYFDTDFVKRAYYMLKKGGELVALVGNVKKKDRDGWYKEKNARIIDFNVKKWEDPSKKSKEEKSATTLNNIGLSIVILNKNDDVGLKEMNMEIDPHLLPEEEELARNYNEGIAGMDDK